jgi:DNA-binding transcriptional LysR family regulator
MQRSERIALELREAERELEALASGDAGQVRLGAFATAASTVVAQAIGAVRSTAPSIDVRLVEGDPKLTLPLLEAGELDLTLDFDYDVLPDPGSAVLIRTVIYEDPFRVALPAGHRYARRRKLRLVDLAGETWIGGPAYACTELLRWLCARSGFQPRVGFETSDYGTVQGLIVAGVGVALIPSRALPNLREGITAYELTDVRAHRRIRLVRRATAHLSGAARRVWDAIEASARSFQLQPAAQTRSRARPGRSLQPSAAGRKNTAPARRA